MSAFTHALCVTAILALGLSYPVVSSGEAAPAVPTARPMVLAGSFVFSPKAHRWYAIENGHVVKQGRASGGRGYCPDIGRSCHTPTGVFRVINKGSASCRSSRYPVGRGGSPMPYCMFFSKNYAVHGSYEVPNHNASHGCIRVPPSDARWLSNHFMHVGTPVIVKSY